MIDVSNRPFTFTAEENTSNKASYSTVTKTSTRGTVSTSPIFESIKETLIYDKLLPLLQTGAIQLIPGPGEYAEFVVAGGFFRNYLDKQNKLFVKNSDDSISDIDIFLLPSIREVRYADVPNVTYLSQNEFTFAIGSKRIRYSTLTLEFNGTKYQFIKTIQYTENSSLFLSPSNVAEVIQGFDFVCCMAGIEFMIWEATTLHKTVFVKDVVMHPDFPLAVANKLLIINPNSVLPVTLERYSKYIGEYGYTPYKADMNKLRDMLGIPENFGAGYE